jgi:folate-binding protein YgfZ
LGVPITWVDLAQIPGEGRTLLRLSGPDAQRFLQGITSADIDRLEAGQAVASALLTVKGKLVSDGVAMLLDDGDLGLAVPAALAADVAAALDRHIIMDDVTVATEPGTALALAWGEGAQALEADGVLAFDTTYPAPGRLLVGASEAIAGSLAGATEVDATAWTRYRVEQGSPAWGHEVEPDRFPPEVGFVQAVSYDKGCFMGQEPLARIHARGQVNWVMVRVEADAAPNEVTPLSHPDREQAGRWTTWVEHGGSVTGLAIVRRSFAVPGTELSAGDAGTVRVVSEPLGDDPGVHAKTG